MMSGRVITGVARLMVSLSSYPVLGSHDGKDGKTELKRENNNKNQQQADK